MRLYITACMCYIFVSLSLFAASELTAQTYSRKGDAIEETVTVAAIPETQQKILYDAATIKHKLVSIDSDIKSTEDALSLLKELKNRYIRIALELRNENLGIDDTDIPSPTPTPTAYPIATAFPTAKPKL